MSTRTALFALCFLLLFPSTLLHAQAANSPYIGQFPAIEDVKAKIKGTDALDTAARQIGAFWQLRKIVEQMSGFRYYQNRLTPEEGRLIGQYNLGYQQAEAAYTGQVDRPTWHKMQSKYTYSDELREELFEKLLTPQIRELWAATEGNTNKAVADGQRRREQEGGVVTVNRQTPTAANAAPVAGPADLSIAKAQAAKVDTKVVGLQLGDPLLLPECDLLGLDSVIIVAEGRATVPRTCVQPSLDVTGLKWLLPYKIDKSGTENIRTISLAKDYCPAWVVECTAYATLQNGRLSGVALFTAGRGLERTVTSDLRAKYGPPTRLDAATITPDTGNPFRVSNPEWVLPGLYVEYDVVLDAEGQEGRVSITKGIVRIMTETEFQRRTAKKKETVKPKL